MLIKTTAALNETPLTGDPTDSAIACLYSPKNVVITKRLWQDDSTAYSLTHLVANSSLFSIIRFSTSRPIPGNITTACYEAKNKVSRNTKFNIFEAYNT